MTLRCCAILCTTVGTTWLVTAASGQGIERAEGWAPTEEQLIAPFRPEHLPSLAETVVPVWIGFALDFWDSSRATIMNPRPTHYADELLLVCRPEFTQWPSEERIRSHQPYDRVEVVRPDLKDDPRVAEPGLFVSSAITDAENWVRALVNEPWGYGPDREAIDFVPIQEEDPYESHILCRVSTSRGDLIIVRQITRAALVVRLAPEVREGVAFEDLGALAAREVLKDPETLTRYKFQEIWSGDGLHLFAQAGELDFKHALQITHWYTDGVTVAMLHQSIAIELPQTPTRAGRPWF